MSFLRKYAKNMKDPTASSSVPLQSFVPTGDFSVVYNHEEFQQDADMTYATVGTRGVPNWRHRSLYSCSLAPFKAETLFMSLSDSKHFTVDCFTKETCSCYFILNNWMSYSGIIIHDYCISLRFHVNNLLNVCKCHSVHFTWAWVLAFSFYIRAVYIRNNFLE